MITLPPEALQPFVDEFNRHFPEQPDSQPPSYLGPLQKLLGKVKFYLGHDDHLWGLDALNIAKRRGLMPRDKPVTLINVDSHSDLYNKRIKRFDDACWVNGAVLRHPEITEVVWVLPQEIKDTCNKVYGPDVIPGKGAFGAFCRTTTLYANRKKSSIAVEEAPMNWVDTPGRRDQVTLHMVTEDQLPNFTNRDVYLSIDMDYFANSGFDTFLGTRVPYKGHDGIRGLFEKLNTAGVSPFLVNTAISPDYSLTRLKGKSRFILPPLAAQIEKLANTIRDICLPNSMSQQVPQS